MKAPRGYTFIYGLVDPRDDEIRYVGKADDPHQRYLVHQLKKMDRDKVGTMFFSRQSEKKLWLHELLALGEKPRLCIIEMCRKDNHTERENYWIKRLGDNGRWLTNATSNRQVCIRGRLQRKYEKLCRPAPESY